MLWYKIGSQDYMDMHPETSFRLFKDDAEVKEWLDIMHNSGWSGTVWVEDYATQEELLDYIKRNNMTLDALTEHNVMNKDYYKAL